MEKEMTNEVEQAYQWAKNQNYPSVAARYAKVLADEIDRLNKEKTSETGFVQCGCGGKARMTTAAGETGAAIECSECEIGTLWFDDRSEAINAWNRAMSGRAIE